MYLDQQFEKKNQSIVIHLIRFLVKRTFFLVNRQLIIRFTAKYKRSFYQFILILFFALASNSIFAQSNTQDITKEKNGEVSQILDDAWDYYMYKRDSMYYLDHLALRLSKKYNLSNCQATAHSQLALYFESEGVYDSAIYHFFKGIEIYETFDSLRHKTINAYFNLAGYYQKMEFFNEAQKALKKSADRAIEYKNYEHLPFVYQLLGSNIMEPNGADSSIIYFKMGMKMVDTLEFENTSQAEVDNLILALNANLCFDYLSINSLDSAKKYLDNYDHYLQKLGPGQNYSEMNLALMKHQYYLAIKDFKNSLRFLDQRLILAKNLGLANDILITLEAHSNHYRIAEQYDSAFFYTRKAMLFKDSLESVQVKQMVAEVETKYQTAEKEKKILKLETDAKLSESRNLLLSGLSIAFGLIIITVSIFYSINRKKSKRLAKQNIIIQESYTEIENLIRESHHRIKNNLQVVSSLLKMQSKNVLSDEAKSALMEAFNRVKTIALLHQRLQGSQSFRKIKVKDFIEQLTGNIKHSLTTGESKIELETNIQSLEIETDDTISIGLIINELITNSIKYAFPEKMGKIEVSLESTAENLVLIVKDNGIGFPENFDPLSGKSLGFKIVKSLATKLKAELEIENQNGALIQIKMKG